ncbi:MAG: ABC transporter permease subunit [Anaerolineae bacterium]|nr:ABC transporter permease subunit [Anaerolineae bacterium]
MSLFRRWEWIGLLPFIVFVIAFQLFPALSIVIRSFLDQANQFSFANIEALNNPVILQSFSSTLQISFLSALTGSIIGFALAWAITWGNIHGSIRSAVLSFCGVAANFAGVPLVFAFISAYGLTGVILGRQGVLTQFLNSVGISLYPGFTLYNFWGLVFVYLFFQIPLMVLVILPALQGLKREWREASENLGATRLQYWRYVAFPILVPVLLSTFALLFANAFGTHATAYALIGGGAGQNLIVTILVGNQFSSDTLNNPGLGYSLALVMVLIMTVTIYLNGVFRRRAERWLQ